MMQLKFLAISLFAITLIACASSERQQTRLAGKRPNIVFILADDLGIGQVGAYRENKIRTPNLDKLAAAGMRFTHAYSGSTLCSPSRVSLLTGRDGRLLHGNENTISLRKQDVTIAQLLKQAGYETRLIGKYGVGDELGFNDPLTAGFDHWFGYMTNIEAHRQYPSYLYRDNEKVTIKENQNNAKGVLAHDLFTREALDYIRTPKQKPFFLLLTYNFPHAELAAPKDTLQQYSNSFKETPYIGIAEGTGFSRFYPEPVAKPRATLAAMVAAIDRDVGRIVTELDNSGLSNDTIVFFTSDNGPHREGGADPQFFEAAAPHRGIKRDLYDGGIRVPMIVRWPGQIDAAVVNDTPWAFADVLPTFADLAGIDLVSVAGVQSNGVSIVSVLKENSKLPERDLYWELNTNHKHYSTDNIRQALRRGQWKVVRYGGNNSMELYNVILDPGESHNLAGQHPELTAEVKAFFDKRLAK